MMTTQQWADPKPLRHETMTTPHPHADILRAIADGKEIQYLRTDLQSNAWEDTEPAHFFRVAAYDYNTEFRIKPEVVIGWISIYTNSQPEVLGSTTHVFRTKEEAIKWANSKPHTVIKISYTPGEGLE